jgi:hypothetical protein
MPGVLENIAAEGGISNKEPSYVKTTAGEARNPAIAGLVLNFEVRKMLNFQCSFKRM